MSIYTGLAKVTSDTQSIQKSAATSSSTSDFSDEKLAQAAAIHNANSIDRDSEGGESKVHEEDGSSATTKATTGM